MYITWHFMRCEVLYIDLLFCIIKDWDCYMFQFCFFRLSRVRILRNRMSTAWETLTFLSTDRSWATLLSGSTKDSSNSWSHRYIQWLVCAYLYWTTSILLNNICSVKFIRNAKFIRLPVLPVEVQVSVKVQVIYEFHISDDLLFNTLYWQEYCI